MASSNCIGAKPRRLSRAVPETIELNRDALTPCCLNTLLGIGARTPPAPYRVLIRKPHEIAMPFLLTRRKCRPMAVRAEPVSALYGKEQDGVWVDGRIRHVGAFPELEDQMLNFSSAGYMGDRSPDRVDALVWAITELMLSEMKGNFLSPWRGRRRQIPSFVASLVGRCPQLTCDRQPLVARTRRRHWPRSPGIAVVSHSGGISSLTPVGRPATAAGEGRCHSVAPSIND